VLLAGTSVSRASLHNQYIMDYVLGGVCIGDTVMVHKSGEIIPEVIQVVKEKRPVDAKPFVIRRCPVCGAEVKTTDVQTICPNDDCPAKLTQHIEYWCSKHVMDIEGIGPKVIGALVEECGVDGVAALYRLTKEQLDNLEVVGPVRGPKLLAALSKSKGQDIDRFIAGLGMSGVGRTIGKELAKLCPDIWAIAKLSKEELRKVPNIGEISANIIYEFFQKAENLNFLHEIESLGFNMKSLEYGTAPEKAPLSGLTFVITRTLPSMSREEAKAIIEAKGGKVPGSVSKKTSYLVAGDAAGSKLQKAQALGIPILSQNDLDRMV